MSVITASGKRKHAKAHAMIAKGTGKITVNNVPISKVSPKIARLKIIEPVLLAEESASKIDVKVTSTGGGWLSQAESARLAIAKALVKYDKNLKSVFLKYDRHLLVADVRQRETRKPNTHGKARSKVQKSYR